MNFFNGIIHNQVFIACFLAWFIAQLIKVVLTYFFENRFDASRFVGSGGMPSSHTSFVTSLATAVGLVSGYESSEFALSLILALVVMYDAAGVRRSVGKQAQILNAIIDDFQKHRKDPLNEERLKELIGHTPIEVFAGAILGILIAHLVV